MNDCIFCRIVSGEIPATKVWDDDNCVVFMDIFPVSRGHILIVPKKHVDNFVSLPVELILPLFAAAQKVATATVRAAGAPAFNLTINNGRESGQEVFHLHLHVIPRTAGDGLKTWPKISYVEDEAVALSAKIKSELEKV